MGDLFGPLRRLTASQLEHPLENFRVQREDKGVFLREATRVGASMAFVLNRAANRRRRDADTPGPPGRPFDGYGSRERYVSGGATEFGAGSAAEGTRVTWFVPDVLRDGESAPVVVYLHGFRASAPDLYWDHIHHLTAQGLVVIFPRINKGGAVGMFTDNDQNEMLSRSVTATEVALEALGESVEPDQLYVFGHSLGGLIGACWNGYGAPAARGIVLAHPSISTDAIPEAARRFITTVDDFDDLVAANEAPVLILGGDQDTLVPIDECLDLARALSGASSCMVAVAHLDEHGLPAVSAGHLATVRSDAKALRWVGQSLGGNQAQDLLQSRFYQAGLDAMIAGETQPTFDFGVWSDGTPVIAPSIEYRSTDGVRHPDDRLAVGSAE